MHLLEQVPHQRDRESARLLRGEPVRLEGADDLGDPLRLRPARVQVATADPILTPLRFRNLKVGNRILRSSISRRFENYDGSGTQARIKWESGSHEVEPGALIWAWCGVDRRGMIVPRYASIERDDRIPFWRELGRRVHEHGCKYILQLAHGGRQATFRGSSLRRV